MHLGYIKHKGKWHLKNNPEITKDSNEVYNHLISDHGFFGITPKIAVDRKTQRKLNALKSKEL